MKVSALAIAYQQRMEAAALRRHGFLEDLAPVRRAEQAAAREAREALAQFRQQWQAVPAHR